MVSPAARGWRVRVGALALVVVLGIVTRWPLAPRYLYSFDAVNFALALEEFRPGKHQPQPPGYPLFVGLMWLLRTVFPTPEQSLTAAGIVGTAAAVVVVWVFAERLAGQRAGWAAAVLLFLHPALWLAGISNPVRTFLAAGSAAVVWTAWESLRGGGRLWFVACGCALGISSGFRPVESVLLAPMFLLAGWRRGWRDWALALAPVSLLTGGWLGVTAWRCGGLPAYWELLLSYAREQLSGHSLLYGALPDRAGLMASWALLWILLPAAAWVWATPFLAAGTGGDRPGWLLLGLWAALGLAFPLLVHIGDPDHTLFAAPAVCLAGALCLDSLRRAGRVVWPAGVLVSAALSAGLFFAPMRGYAGWMTYGFVADKAAKNASTLQAIEALRRRGPLTMIHYRSFVSWRQVGFYFPDVPLYVLHADHRGPTAPSSVWRLEGLQRRELRVIGDAVEVPADTTLALLLPPAFQDYAALGTSPPLLRLGPVLYLPRVRDAFSLGRYCFVPGARVNSPQQRCRYR